MVCAFLPCCIPSGCSMSDAGVSFHMALSILPMRPFTHLMRLARGPKSTLKWLVAPRSWMLDKLSGTYALRPSPGPHKRHVSLSLNAFLCNRLKYALNGCEVTAIVNPRLVKSIASFVGTGPTLPVSRNSGTLIFHPTQLVTSYHKPNIAE